MSKRIKLLLIKSFKTVIAMSLIMFISTEAIIKVNAEEQLEDPYIDITFDTEAKENKNHGNLQVFENDKTNIYGNKSITYDIDQYGTYMAWTSNHSRGGGFNLNIDKTIGENYTIALKFSFNDTGEISGGWKKIIDFQKTGSDADSGFYFYNNGQIQFYPESSQGPYIKNNEVVDLLIRRNGNTKKFDVYNRVGDSSVLCYEFIDVNGLSVFSNGLGFFHDDYATSSEASAGGKVYSVKIWDSYVDVDAAWAALDKEKEDSLSRYACKLIASQEPTEITSGWKSYYECKDKEDDSYKYFEDDTYSVEIADIEKWKEESGYVPQLKSIGDIINDLKGKIENITEENVKSGDKATIEDVKNTIDKIDIKNITEEEKNELKQIEERCDLLIKIIEDTAKELKNTNDYVEKYSDEQLSKEDKDDIKNQIIKAKLISSNNLTNEENEKHTSNIKILGNYLGENYTYEFLNGDNQEFYEGKIENYIFRIDGDYSLFDTLLIGDLQLTNGTDYTVTEGSTIITFEKDGLDKLNKLKVGNYDIVVKYSNSKKAMGKLIIKPLEENPQTGDKIVSTIIVGSISLIGLTGCLLYIKKRKKNNK